MYRSALVRRGRFWRWAVNLPILIAITSSMAMASIVTSDADSLPSSVKAPALPVFLGISLFGRSPLDWPDLASMQGPHAPPQKEAQREAAEPVRVLAALGQANLSLAERWTLFGEKLPQSPREGRRAVPAGRSDVLGSVALPVSQVPQSRRWHTMLEERADSYFVGSCSASASACAEKLRGRLTDAVTIARGQYDRDAIDTVNKAVNTELKYRRDLDGYGIPDYWATVEETLARGSGDCEEFAVLKMWMLLAAGFDRSQIRLQLVKLLKTAEDHAILVVDIGAGRLVLDNLSASVLDDSQVSEYLPLLSFVGGDAYLHGFKRRPARSNEVAALR